jgi:hypothetical protein
MKRIIGIVSILVVLISCNNQNQAVNSSSGHYPDTTDWWVAVPTDIRSFDGTFAWAKKVVQYDSIDQATNVGPGKTLITRVWGLDSFFLFRTADSLLTIVDSLGHPVTDANKNQQMYVSFRKPNKLSPRIVYPLFIIPAENAKFLASQIPTREQLWSRVHPDSLHHHIIK